MKQVIMTFFCDTKEDFQTFVKMFEDEGYEVAKSTGMYQAVVITERPVEGEDETEGA